MDEVELERYAEWGEEHDKTCVYYDDGTQAESPQGAIGGRLSFCFTPTGVGTAIVIKCACDEEVNVTNYGEW